MWGYFSFLRSGHVWDVSFRQGRASLQCTESRTTQPGLPLQAALDPQSPLSSIHQTCVTHRKAPSGVLRDGLQS